MLREKGVQKAHLSIKVIPSLGRVLQNFVLRPYHLDLALRAVQRARGAGQHWGGCPGWLQPWNVLCTGWPCAREAQAGPQARLLWPHLQGHGSPPMAVGGDAACREFCWAREPGRGWRRFAGGLVISFWGLRTYPSARISFILPWC